MFMWYSGPCYIHGLGICYMELLGAFGRDPDIWGFGDSGELPPILRIVLAY